MRRWLVVLALLALTGCEDKEGSQEGAVAGPAIDVHCDGLAPRAGLGDTSVRVSCAP
jgi:hypothetical protein